MIPGEFAAQLREPLGLVLAGTAGEHVQSAASLLARAAMRAGLQVTQKNDNPVTQGTGFSASDLILSAEEILFTGIEEPDTLLVVSEDGARELERNAVFTQVRPETLVLADLTIPLPDLPCQVLRYPIRSAAGAQLAGLAAIVAWLSLTSVLPLEALWASLEARFGTEAAATRAKLSPFLEAA